MHVHIRLLGAFQVTVDDRPVPAHAWRRRSAANLVKLLALQPQRRLLRDQVVDVLWPELTLDDAAPRLHSAAHYARAALDQRDAVVLAGGTVTLLPDADVTVDVADFERAADAALVRAGAKQPSGRSADHGEARAGAAEDALARYGGTLLPEDVYEEWTEEPRERLHVRHLELLRATGRYDELVAADPLDEEAQLARAADHVRHGRRQSALRSLDAMEELFRRELGVAPGPAAVALRRQVESLPVEPPVVPEQRTRTAPTPDPTLIPAPGPSPEPADPPRRAPLPPARNRLVGRTADLERITGLLHQHRIVTLAGPGGAGKSTLALALGRRFPSVNADVAPTDVILAELAPVRDEAGVTRAVAEAAGVQGAGAEHTAALAANLGPRPVLLVLDNCEHLLDASAALVDAVLDAGGQARVLVTSREPLQVDGEAVHRIGSLGADSSELFVERATAAAGPGIVAADDPRVIDLCRRLDGLPLAIELAAAQLRHLSLDQLIERLDDRLTLLVGGRPKAGQRHSALTATIDWSYRLLSEDARHVFDRLGVFPAGFDLAAVQAVVDTLEPGRVTNLVGDLVAKSLVVHDPVKQRYRLLETIRLFAAHRLDQAGQRSVVTDLLRRHVVARARTLARVPTWLSATVSARSRDDLDNVRLAFDESLDVGDLAAAVDVALSLSTLWRNAVSYAEGARWVAALRRHALTPCDEMWTQILAADVGLGSGDPRLLRDATTRAIALSRQVDDPGGTALASTYGGLALMVDPQRAIARLAQARDQARAAGEPGLERLTRAYQMVARRLLGESDGLVEEARELTESGTGYDYDRYLSLWTASLLALVDRDAPRLRGLMDAQLADLSTSGLQGNWLTMYWEALTATLCGEDHLALLRRAKVRAEAEGRRADADCALALGFAAACQDRWEEAAELAGASQRALLADTAGYIHHRLVADQLVRPRLDPDVFAAAVERGRHLDLARVLSEHGL